MLFARYYCIQRNKDAGLHMLLRFTNFLCLSIYLSVKVRVFVGWEGTRCTRRSNDCIGHRCRNGATCVDGYRTYTCRCAPGYTGMYTTVSSYSLNCKICCKGWSEYGYTTLQYVVLMFCDGDYYILMMNMMNISWSFCQNFRLYNIPT